MILGFNGCGALCKVERNFKAMDISWQRLQDPPRKVSRVPFSPFIQPLLAKVSIRLKAAADAA